MCTGNFYDSGNYFHEIEWGFGFTTTKIYVLLGLRIFSVRKNTPLFIVCDYSLFSIHLCVHKLFMD